MGRIPSKNYRVYDLCLSLKFLCCLKQLLQLGAHLLAMLRCRSRTIKPHFPQLPEFLKMPRKYKFFSFSSIAASRWATDLWPVQRSFTSEKAYRRQGLILIPHSFSRRSSYHDKHLIDCYQSTPVPVEWPNMLPTSPMLPELLWTSLCVMLLMSIVTHGWVLNCFTEVQIFSCYRVLKRMYYTVTSHSNPQRQCFEESMVEQLIAVFAWFLPSSIYFELLLLIVYLFSKMHDTVTPCLIFWPITY